MLHAMHGEIYGGMEHSFETVHQPDTAGAGEKFWWRGDFLVASEGREPNNGCTSRGLYHTCASKMGGKVCINRMGGYRRNQHESPLLQYSSVQVLRE
jgi:hypothetical protein